MCNVKINKNKLILINRMNCSYDQLWSICVILCVSKRFFDRIYVKMKLIWNKIFQCEGRVLSHEQLNKFKFQINVKSFIIIIIVC